MGADMRRRTFIAGLSVAAAAGRAQAQRTAKVYRIARIYAAQPVAEAIKARNTQGSVAWFFFEELHWLGFVEGQKRMGDLHNQCATAPYSVRRKRFKHPSQPVLRFFRAAPARSQRSKLYQEWFTDRQCC